MTQSRWRLPATADELTRFWDDALARLKYVVEADLAGLPEQLCLGKPASLLVNQPPKGIDGSQPSMK